ncbi:MAG: hypothetical protein QM493_11265 [Sulfurovum sp.]
MYILIPVDNSNGNNSNITTLINLKFWALINFDEGQVKSLEFFEKREDISVGWIDFIILENRYEAYIEFMNEGMMILVRREENTIEEIISAFRFKELDEV